MTTVKEKESVKTTTTKTEVKAEVKTIPAKETVKVEPVKETEVKQPFHKKGVNKKDKKLSDAALSYPEHMRDIAFLLKNNSEIRRFTSIGIINYLLQKGEIRGEKRYVKFLWNKFSVKVDGMHREYAYTEPFFLNCLVAAFTSFAASAQKTIDIFVKKEMMVGIEKATDKDDIESIVKDTKKYYDGTAEKSEE